MNYTINQIRQAWLAAALQEWSHPTGADPMRNAVRDDDRGKEGDRDLITGYFAACGWSFHLARYGGTYRETADTSWCGIFAGAMGKRIGDHLEPNRCVAMSLDADVCKHVMPSTARLASRNKWRAAGVPSPRSFSKSRVTTQFLSHDSGVLVDAAAILLPGVLATVKTSGNKPEVGDHIVLIERYDLNDEVIDTVEGNGRGQLGDGTRGEGVVRCVRKLEDIVRVYHFDLAHFEGLER